MNTTRAMDTWTLPGLTSGRALSSLRAALRASHARRADRRASARTIAAYPATRGVATPVLTNRSPIG